EKNRIQILRGLMKRPDMLILDEPGNHLDAWGLAWLEGVLSSHPAAVLVVSHNRYLMDRVVTRIWELRGGRIVSYTGNYSAYRSATLRRAVKSAADARADKKHLERLEAMVSYLAALARARPDRGIGKRLRARRTQLRRAREHSREAISIEDGTVTIGFGSAAGKADIALDIRGFSYSYGERTLFCEASSRILVGERVALIGANGSGKTTLLQRIVDDAHWDHPSLRLGPSMRVGYCAQTRHGFRADGSVEDNLRDLGRYTRDDVFGLISRSLFEYRDLTRPVGTLSGGEINRLQLARAELLGATFLILDEPTNHLDIASREAVEEALLRFRGTVLIVSHDRYLLDSVVGRVLYLVDGRIESFDGGFSDFWYTVGRWDGPQKGENKKTTPEPDETTEERLIALEARKIEIERHLKRAYADGDLKTAKALSRDLEKTQRLYDKLYAEWS
ncbi:MAG: ATP-binding cassette domain-containing protein, partial [Spirochaetales bacterium]|nr:ATP-binding cassette domain-containing protein [Spirochaetales bacterium]